MRKAVLLTIIKRNIFGSEMLDLIKIIVDLFVEA